MTTLTELATHDARGDEECPREAVGDLLGVQLGSWAGNDMPQLMADAEALTVAGHPDLDSDYRSDVIDPERERIECIVTVGDAHLHTSVFEHSHHVGNRVVAQVPGRTQLAGHGLDVIEATDV